MKYFTSVAALLSYCAAYAAAQPTTFTTAVSPSGTATAAVMVAPRGHRQDPHEEKAGRMAFGPQGGCKDYCEAFPENWRCNLWCVTPTCKHKQSMERPEIDGCANMHASEGDKYGTGKGPNTDADREAEDAARRQAGIDWLATQPIPNFDD